MSQNCKLIPAVPVSVKSFDETEYFLNFKIKDKMKTVQITKKGLFLLLEKYNYDFFKISSKYQNYEYIFTSPK